jgi:hypothetical protein
MLDHRGGWAEGKRDGGLADVPSCRHILRLAYFLCRATQSCFPGAFDLASALDAFGGSMLDLNDDSLRRHCIHEAVTKTMLRVHKRVLLQGKMSYSPTAAALPVASCGLSKHVPLFRLQNARTNTFL